MRRFIWAISLGLTASSMQWGCRDDSPPPPNVPVPTSRDREAIRRPEPVKPLPEQPAQAPGATPFYDEPLLVDAPPEAKPFVEAYNKAGRPRIAVFVNRTLDGKIVPTNPSRPLVRVDEVRRSDTGVTVERRDSRVADNRWGRNDRESTERFQSTGPGEYRETTEVYLRPGQYDEVSAKAVDYAMMENLLTDWLSADNQVRLVSPTIARQRLTEQQVKDLQAGRPQVLRELAQQLDAQVLVQAEAKVTRQTPQGLEVRVIAEAFNINDGQSIARAAVDVPPPLEKTTLNRYTRFLARKLMDGMIMSWSQPAPAPAPAESSPAPAPGPRNPAPNPLSPTPAPAPTPAPIVPAPRPMSPNPLSPPATRPAEPIMP